MDGHGLLLHYLLAPKCLVHDFPRLSKYDFVDLEWMRKKRFWAPDYSFAGISRLEIDDVIMSLSLLLLPAAIGENRRLTRVTMRFFCRPYELALFAILAGPLDG